MKYAVYLAALTMMALNTAYASEMANPEENISAYCTEQAELAGIDNLEEKNQYIQDCIDSYEPSSDGQQRGE